MLHFKQARASEMMKAMAGKKTPGFLAGITGSLGGKYMGGKVSLILSESCADLYLSQGKCFSTRRPIA